VEIMPGWQIILSFFLCFTLTVNAEIYTWVDSKGVSHFTDERPESRDHEQVKLGRPLLIPMQETITRGKPVTNVTRQPKGSGEAGSANEPKLKEKREARSRQRQKARCDGYREKLERIQQQLRAGYSNDKGNRLRRQRREVNQKLSWECLLG
jgi:hypothetical protein